MARNDEERFRELWIGAGKNGVNAFEMERLAGSALGSGLEFVDHDLQLAAGILGDFVQARNNVIAAAPNTALGVGPGRKRQPSPTGNQLVDQGAHRFFVDTLLPRSPRCVEMPLFIDCAPGKSVFSSPAF